MSGDRVLFYRFARCGDFIRGHESIEVDGEDAEVKPIVAGAIATIIEKGGNSRLEIEAIATLKLRTSETDDDFMWRKLQFGVAIGAARSLIDSNYSNAGILAVCSDSDNLYTSTNAESAGSNVDIELDQTVSFTLAGTEKFFITDGLNYEVFTGAAGSWLNKVRATTLVNSYLAGASVFRPAYYIPGTYLRAGIKLTGNEAEAFESVREIPLKFFSLEAPQR